MISAGFDPIRNQERQSQYDDEMKNKIDIFNPNIRVKYKCGKFDNFLKIFSFQTSNFICLHLVPMSYKSCYYQKYGNKGF